MTSRSPSPVARPLALVMPLAHAAPVDRASATVFGAFRTLPGLGGHLRLACLPPALVMHAAHAPAGGSALTSFLRAFPGRRPVHVGLLLSSRCPPDVAGLVVPVPVRVTVERVEVNPSLPAGDELLRPRADLGFDVSDEPGQGVPLRTDRDAPSAVPGIVGRGGILATAPHLMPDAEKGMLAFPRCEAVPSALSTSPSLLLRSQRADQSCRSRPSFGGPSRHPRGRVVALETTRLLSPMNQLGDLGDRRVTAVALANGGTPAPGLFWRGTDSGVGANHGEAAESLPHFNEGRRRVAALRIHETSMPAIGAAHLGMVA
jgi:hypothetical protein